ncbi:MAG: SPOR domain-containing protein [Planctomycetes bacterium]|nr:SPOR domain-containing protein [Planctomycetota bacterium]
MFEKREAPELYELLNKNRIQIGKPPVQTSAPKPEAVTKSAESYTVPELVTPRPYPKFKSSLVQAPRAAAVPAAQKTERKVTLNYNILVFGVIILAIIILVAYAIGRNWSPTSGGSADHSAGIPAPQDTDGEAGRSATPTPPPTAPKTYSIRLIYYEDNPVGQKSAERIIKFLNERNVSGVFTRTEKIQGKNQIVIYVGRYKTKEEASKLREKYKELDRGFRHCDIVEGK